MSKPSARSTDRVPMVMLVYTAASLIHFVHNATYLHEYPNMPSSLTALGVYGAWCAVASVGLLGYWVYRRVHHTIGRVIIGCYAVLGFAGLDHYFVAPISAHSWAMHLTILIEVACAAWLLSTVLFGALQRHPDVQ